MIKKIILQIDGKDIEMSMEEAKGLYSALKDLFDHSQTIYWPLVYPWNRPYYYGTVYAGSTCKDGTITYTLNGGSNSQEISK